MSDALTAAERTGDDGSDASGADSSTSGSDTRGGDAPTAGADAGAGTDPDGDGDDAADAEDGGADAPAATVTREPTTLGTTLAILSALVVVAVAAPFSPAAAGLAGVGTVCLALVSVSGSRRLVDFGGVGLLAATVGLGAAGPVEATLVAAVASVLAWDVAGNAVDVGVQLGRAAGSARAELAHAGGTLAVGGLTAALGYVVFELAGGGRPVTALVLLLAAAVVITSALRV